MCLIFPFCSRNEKALWDNKQVTTVKVPLKNFKKDDRLHSANNAGPKNENIQSEIIRLRNYSKNLYNRLTIG